MNKQPSQKNERISFAKTEIQTKLPNLIETQKLSYDAFLQRDPNDRTDTGLQAVFREIFPEEDKEKGIKSGIRDFSDTNSLEFVNYTLGTPKYTLQECIARGVTYQVSLTARIMMVLREADPDADEPHVVDIRESDVYLGEIPLMTENGSFIVNGSERVIVSQLHRSPGVIFLEKSLPTGRRTPTAQIIPYRGAWVEFEIDTKDQIYVRIDKRRKLPATVLLRALGWQTDADILQLYAKTEQLVLAGWKVTSVEGPAIQVKPGDLLNAAEFRQAKKDYPDIEVEKYYRVTKVPEKECPLEVGQELTYKERTNLRRKWKGFETELSQRVIDTHNSGCEFTVGQILTNSEYEAARARYGKKAFTAEQITPDDGQDRVCAEDIVHQETDEVLLTANTLLTETELERLKEAGVEAITVLDEEDCRHIVFLRNTLERDRQADYDSQHSLQDAALLTIFRTLRPGDAPSIENARKHLAWLLFDAHRYDLGVVGRYKLNRKFTDVPIYEPPPSFTAVENSYKVTEPVREGFTAVENSYEVTKPVREGLTAVEQHKVVNGPERSNSLEILDKPRRVPERVKEDDVKAEVKKYFESLHDVDGFKASVEQAIKIGNVNAKLDVDLYSLKEGKRIAIAECKGTDGANYGRRQLFAYLSATNTRFGIFANSLDRDDWVFYENLRHYKFREIDRDHFETKINERDYNLPDAALEFKNDDESLKQIVQKVKSTSPGSDLQTSVEDYFSPLLKQNWECNPDTNKEIWINTQKEKANKEKADFLLQGRDGRYIAIVETRDGASNKAVLNSLLCATDTRFGIIASSSDPEKWSFWERVGSELPSQVDADEFAEKMVLQAKESSRPLKGDMLTQDELDRHRKTWKDLETEPVWRVTQVFHSKCRFKVGDLLSDDEYKKARTDYPGCPAKEGGKLTRAELEDYRKTWKDLETEPIWRVTEVFHSDCPFQVDEELSDAEYKQAREDYPGYPVRRVTEVFHSRCRFKVGDLLSDDEYKKAYEEDKTVPETVRTLRPEDIAATVDYLLRVHNGLKPKDDLDHLGNRRVRVIGELLENQFRMGLLQIRRTTRERLSTNNDLANVVPSSLVNPKPLMMALREFFGSNQLSQFMQQINPLDELTHKRRISAIGPGGLHRDRATAAVRDVHRTHYGRVCPLETPEGPSIGLIVSLACYGRINPYGFIETPYHKVENGTPLKSVEYLTADGEDSAHIAAKATPRNVEQNGDSDASGHLIPVRSGEEVLSLPMEKIDYIGVAPQQIVGISAALVPFLEHEDANRALMGANHQRQAVPLIRPEAPLVGTGMEGPAARYSGALITAKRAGTVTSVSADEILIYTGEALHHDEGENTFSEMGYDVYKLQTFKRSNSGTCIHQRPIVAVGDTVEAEQVIADGTSTEDGELALGRNILCAYMPWGGHNYEDSILISETLIKEDTFTSIHIEEFEVEARETKVGPEEITRDIPNVSERRLSQLDEEGIIRVGSVVKAGSILVGKITPKGESDYGPEQKLLQAIFGEKVKDVRDASTYVRPGVEGVVIDVKVFSRKPDGAQRRSNWQTDSGASMADELRFESKRKQIDETWRQQTASIRRRKVEEIRNTLTGCELTDPLLGVRNSEPLANAGDTLTAEILDAYISGTTAEESYTVTEDTAAEAFIAEQRYKVTSAPEPIPTVALYTPDASADGTIDPDSDESEDFDFEEIGISEASTPGIFTAVQEYFQGVCEPLLGNTEINLPEDIATSEQVAYTGISLLGADRRPVTIALRPEAHTDDEGDTDESDTEHLQEALAAADARFGVLLTDDLEPDNWEFYELGDDAELKSQTRPEFEQSVLTQLEAAGFPFVEDEELSEVEWENFSEIYPDLQADPFWEIKEVFDPTCPLAPGQKLSDADYQKACSDFPAHPVSAGQRLTAEEKDELSKTAKDVKIESVWYITAVFDPKSPLSVGEHVSDADYQKAIKECSLSFSDIRVTNTEVREHIQRIEEMAQGRITAYTEEKEQALQQLEMGDELKPGVIKRVKVYVASKRPISVGDKMAGRYGNKGVVAKILPAEDMPYMPDGTPVELVLNPLGVPSRMNVGQILEIHLGWACHELGQRVKSPVFDGATEAEVFEELAKTDLPARSKETGKSILFDGRTGEPFAQEITVGYVYFLKLNHLVADKMHARSTGPYSLVTQQPLGGKAQHGGQRLGEMEVWALEAYGAAHTLQEMLTLKSDDVLGRREIYESVVKGLNPEPPGTPESFKVLVRELQTLGLHVSLDQDEE